MGWTIPVQPVAYTPQIATDTTQRTVTSGTFGQISGAFSIPANDPSVGSVYKLRVWGVAGANTSTMSVRPQIFGVNLASLASTTAPSSWYAEAWLLVTAIGASGSVLGHIVLLGGTPDIAVISATTVNTTAASTMLIQASGTGVGPSITGDGSVYERDGPGAIAQ